jgi:PAS domain S-box-containing protein
MQAHPNYEQILSAIPTGIIAINREGHITHINSYANKCLNQDNKKIIGAHVSEISSHFSELTINCLETGETIFMPNLAVRKEILQIEITPIHQQHSIIGAVCSLCTGDEVETYKRTLESYNLLQLQFDALMDFTSYGIWVLDGEGTVLKVNSSAEKLIGIKAKDVVGKNIVRLVEKNVIDQALTPYVIAAKRPVSKLLYVLKTKKHIMSSGTPVLDKDGNIILVIVTEHDMTTLNSLQEQLNKMRSMAKKYREALSDLNLSGFKGDGIIAESQEMRQVLRISLKLARLDVSNILILGESGTGKELIAKFIYENSKRKNKPFIQINCAALPETLLEAELFGFEKGAFTGAPAQGKIGLFEMAQGGTILLDEIGELPLSVQVKLLKFLDEHEIMHLGGLKPIKIDCIIITATNRNLKALVDENKFREDLYHRLNAFNIQIPPLRQRPEDIVGLAAHYIEIYNKEYKLKKRLSLKAITHLQSHPFYGNVRELKNMLKNTVVLSDSDIIDEFIPETVINREIHKSLSTYQNAGHIQSLTEQLNNFEREILERAIMCCNSTRQMADYLKTSQSRIVRMLKKHDMSTKPC